uniref:CUT domain-containing protein n=1 Tax=Meloidogyne hapla TaxID=6305 RepID=A0A1I8B6J5_MELHA
EKSLIEALANLKLNERNKIVLQNLRIFIQYNHQQNKNEGKIQNNFDNQEIDLELRLGLLGYNNKLKGKAIKNISDKYNIGQWIQQILQQNLNKKNNFNSNLKPKFENLGHLQKLNQEFMYNSSNSQPINNTAESSTVTNIQVN